MKNKPAKKPAARMTTRDGKPVVFPPTWGQVTSSSRTQPPKQPGKVAGVRRPMDKHGWSINYNSIGTYAEFCDECFSYDPRHIRAVAAWLTHAAAYIEQEGRRGKKTT